ncbi:putative serine-rich protein [Micromonospora noduli]|nr:putative serine-rich protein [Micromonospora noduli]
MPATDSGATTSARRLPLSFFSTQATSWSPSSSSRCAVVESSSRAALACCLRTGSGSSALMSPIASRAERVAASSSVHASRSGVGSPAVIRPAGASASPTARASPAAVSASAVSGRSSVRARRVVRSISSGTSSACAAEETRSASSCASSTMSSLCGGTMCRSASMSTASRLWLVTTMSASRARARDASAKHSCPNGQRAAPTHSRAGIDTSRQAWSSTPGSSSSRSPVAVFSAQSRSRSTCLPSRPASPSHFVPPPGRDAGASKRVSSGSSSVELSSRARQR